MLCVPLASIIDLATRGLVSTSPNASNPLVCMDKDDNIVLSRGTSLRVVIRHYYDLHSIFETFIVGSPGFQRNLRVWSGSTVSS